MKYYNNILEVIGDTPLVRLQRIAKGLRPVVLAKLEYLNPGGSVKDRMALYMIEKAVHAGELKPGGTIIEATSGNTGVGLAMYAAVKGFRMIFTIPDKMSKEKINLLKAFGAEIIICPTDVPAESELSYYEVAKRKAREIPNSYFVNQYSNLDNVEAHYELTGPEIWKQTEGKIDYFVAGAGTGGTVSGVGRFLKEKKADIKIIAVDPIGSVYFDWFKSRKLVKPSLYNVEGIGEDKLCETMRFEYIDDIIQVSDRDAFLTARRLIREEGILAGGSSGAAVYAALQIAKGIDGDKTIVVILPDTARNYLSKFLDEDWMKEKGFL